MKKLSFLLALNGMVFLLSSSSCKKEQIPPSELVTVNGKTFGCRVNGTPFIADKWDYGNNVPPIHVTIWFDPVGRYHYLIVSGNKQNERVELYLNPPLVQGRRQLLFNTLSYPTVVEPKDYGVYRIFFPNKEFITNETVGGYVDILYADTITQKIEGRFDFTGTDRNTGEKITVTNGYFKNF